MLGVGTTLGIVAMAAVLVPALRRARVRLSPVFAWRDPTVITMLRLSGWTVGYVIANEIAQVFVLVLANPLAGGVSAYVYAFTFYQVPQGLLAVSIMTTMTPELARRVAANDMPGLRRDFDLGVRYLVVLVLPASVLFACLAQPMIGILSHGVFAADNAAMTADVLQAFAISSVPLALYLYTLRGFYALRDTRTPFLINCFENALNIAFAVGVVPVARRSGSRPRVERGLPHLRRSGAGRPAAPHRRDSGPVGRTGRRQGGPRDRRARDCDDSACRRDRTLDREPGVARDRRRGHRRWARLRRGPCRHPFGGAAFAARPRPPTRRDAGRRVTMRPEPKSNANVLPAAEE